MKKTVLIMVSIILIATIAACEKRTSNRMIEKSSDIDSSSSIAEDTIDGLNWNDTIVKTINNIKYAIPFNYTTTKYGTDEKTYVYKNGEITVSSNSQSTFDDAETYTVKSDNGNITFAVKSDTAKDDIKKIRDNLIIEQSDSTTTTTSKTTSKKTTTTKQTTTTKRTTTTTAPRTTVTTTTTNSVPLGMRNALGKAQDYLSFMAFSYLGLIEQLEYEQFTHEEAVYGASNCGANWYDQAVKKAQNYLNAMAFSYTGIIEQLEYEQFTHDEAVYGANNCGANWYDQAAKKAQNYLSFSSFSRQDLIDQLIYEGFSQSEAEYGVSAVGY